MKTFVGTLLFIGLTMVAWSDKPTPAKMPPLESMPPPPSVAINPAPMDASADVTVWVNVIPASAKYVIHAQLAARSTRRFTSDDAPEASKNVSQATDQLQRLARERGANLIVVVCSEHGIDVPIKQTTQPLRLRADDPSVTVVLFRCEKIAPPTAAETHLRFTTQPPPTKGEYVNYKIELQAAPAGLDLATWVYGNISRFVADATQRGFDTVTLRCTNDTKHQKIWLPGCDDPLRVSLTKPELNVTIFKRVK